MLSANMIRNQTKCINGIYFPNSKFISHITSIYPTIWESVPLYCIKRVTNPSLYCVLTAHPVSPLFMPGTARKKNILNVSAYAGYIVVVISIVYMWSLRDQNLIRAADGIGYWLGIVGSLFMLALLFYPLRKRIRFLKNTGSVKFWFQTHMLFGVLGPLLVLFHSNFTLGSLNGRIALFCTLTVSSSGLIGRYLYSKFHYGMHGQKATVASLQSDISTMSSDSSRHLSFVHTINERLRPFEEKVLARSHRVIPSVIGAFSAPFTIIGIRRELKAYIQREVNTAVDESETLSQHKDHLLQTAENYLAQRIAAYRKLAQISGCERLFGLWHVVHYPLFLVMLLAAIVHIYAVHAY